MIQADTGLAILGTHDTNRHWSGNIGYTRYKQTLVWKHWIHMIQTDNGLETLGTQDTNRHWPGCCQASVCFYLVYPKLSGQCLFLSCVPNVARPVSVFILCTQCCQARVCLYLVYPMLPGQCLFVSCVPNVAKPESVCILCTQCYQTREDTNRHWPGNIGYTRYKQTRAWKHWVHKIKTDTGLKTLGTQDKNRHGPGSIGYT
jgi:hypothetical protein